MRNRKLFVVFWLSLILLTIICIFAINTYSNCNSGCQGNCKDGYGTYVGNSGNRYEGEWKDCRMDGRGVFIDTNGSKYEGQWQNGKRDGTGTLIEYNGRTYTGEWKDGQRDGIGTVTESDGRTYTGEWKNGKPHGQGILSLADGTKKEGTFKDGKFYKPIKEVIEGKPTVTSSSTIPQHEVVKRSDETPPVSGSGTIHQQEVMEKREGVNLLKPLLFVLLIGGLGLCIYYILYKTGLLKREYICPFCFNKNSLYKVKFRCTNDPKKCKPQQDPVLSKIMSRVIDAPPPGVLSKLGLYKTTRETVCPSCNETTAKRICPDCHWELPYTIGDYRDMIFAVIGGKDSGKSHYISVLLDKLMNDVGRRFDCNLLALNDNTIDKYREHFYNPIFKRKEIIQSTLSARSDVNVRIPLIYTISFMGKGLFKQKKVTDVVTMSFFDTAGEDLNAEDTMSTENKYIYNSSGIIFLLDPLQLDSVRKSLPAGIPTSSASTESTDILARTANLIRKAKKMKINELIDIPVAVAFSKIDALDALIGASSCLKYQSKHTNSFNLRDYEDVNAEMEALVREWSGDSIIQQLRLNFKSYSFFGLTALGCNPHGDAKISQFKPRRVEDPFLWLLWKHNIIKGNK